MICASFSLAKVVQDSDGVSVEIPDNVEITTPIIGAFTQMSAMLGVSDRVILAAPKLPDMMMKIFPKLRTTGNISGLLPSSVEAIIASDTQVVFGP